MGTRKGRFTRLLAMLVGLFCLLGAGPAGTAAAAPDLAAPPAQVNVSQRSTLAILSWSATDDAAGYAVAYDTDPSFTSARRVTTDHSLTVINALEPGTTYYVRVASWEPASSSTGDWSQTTAFTTSEPSYPFLAPKIAVSAQTTSSVTATWDPIEGASQYQIAVGPDAAGLTPAKTVTAAAATVGGLQATATYFVAVRAVNALGDALSPWSSAESVTIPETFPLRVGSYNILCPSCSKGKASWSKRRGPLVESVRAQDLDVLGVQEASIGGVAGGGLHYMDLINRLGAPYKLTEYGRSVSPDVRIVYNSDRVELKDHGIVKLPKGSSRRFMDWAIFEQKSTGKRFFVSNTHLEPRDGRKGWNARKRQAAAIVQAIKRLNPDDLPVIATGDYASTKWEKWGNKPYDIMQAAGYLDPLGNAYRTHQAAPGAFVENRVRTSYASLNMYKRKARNFAPDTNGSNTDYIFVTKMRVEEYEVVMKLDANGRFVGVIPSDHNLIRATVYLP